MEIAVNADLVSRCGLYCGACSAYLKGKCPGCVKNEKASWCKIRSCTSENKFLSCADCTTYSNANDCRKFNNIMSKIFAVLFRSNRKACIEQIKALGRAGHAKRMAELGLQSLKN
jgi:hypothetical protein